MIRLKNISYLCLLILLVAIVKPKQSFGQTLPKDLTFDHTFLNALDHWIALPMEKDSTFIYGFVYLDNMAGLTFNLEGNFKIGNKGEFIPKKDHVAMIKTRLEPTNKKVAIIKSERFKELQVEEFPNWYKIYTPDPNAVDRLFRLGNVYNHWNEPAKALPYLDAAYQINPNYNGLAYERSFAFNALKQYDKAIAILTLAIKADPKSCLLYQELIYAQMNKKTVNEAIESCQQALDVCTDKNLRSQLLRDIVYHYYQQKNKEQFENWAEKAKKEMAGNANALQVIAKWETELNQ